LPSDTSTAGERFGNIKTAFNGALRRSGLAKKGYRFHDIRRTFATMLYNRGVHLTKIQRLLGHKSITTTERYLGVKFEETREAISVLDIPSLKALAAPQVAIPSAKQIATPIEIAISRVS
jgi:integrase